MPRVCDSANEPADYCRFCMPAPDTARRRHGAAGGGPDGRGNCYEYDADHPPYAGESYRCRSCGVTLREEDDLLE